MGNYRMGSYQMGKLHYNPSNLIKDWCQDSWGPDQFPAPKSPSENDYYLFNSRF